MIEAILLVLVLLWFVGMGTAVTAGGAIHFLLVAAFILLIFRALR